MNDDNAGTGTTGRSRATTTARAGQARAQEMVAEMRKQVDEAAVEVERLTAELDERSRALDDLESVADVVLGMVDTAVVVVGADRRVRALSRGAAEMLGVSGPVVGRPLSTVVPDEVVEAVHHRLDPTGDVPDGPVVAVAGDTEVTTTAVGDTVVVVLRRT